MKTPTIAQMRYADSLLNIDNAGPNYDERYTIFLSAVFLLENRAIDPVAYRNKKKKLYGDMFDEWFYAARETMNDRTCLADWMMKCDVIISNKMKYLSLEEVKIASANAWKAREDYFNTIDGENDE